MELPAAADSPRAWLEAYIQHRGRLAALDAQFSCDPACSRPGCTHPELVIPVSLLDLWGAAHFLGERAADLYHRAFTLGLVAEAGQDWLRTPVLRLKKPCPFFGGELCAIYPARPLACILFPEYLVVAGTLAAHAAREHFRDYRCLHRPLTLTPARREAMAALMRLWRRELLITSFRLFGRAPCYVECRDFLPIPAGKQGSEPGFIAPPWLEQCFREQIAIHPPFADLAGTIAELHHSPGQAALLQAFLDDRLYRTLTRQGTERVAVFRLKKRKLRLTRRSLRPPEVAAF
jgi:Fe-S-cluster containining protein